MKTLPSILLSILLAACTACTNPAPVPPAPPAPPAPVVVGHYIIREYDVNGNIKHVYTDVAAYKERAFPRSVTFDYGGAVVTLSGSYQISRSPQ